MALTVLNPLNDNVKAVKIRIIADTVLSRDGKGIPIYFGSVMSVKPHEAADLIASVKAEYAKPEDVENVITNPHSPEKGTLQKAGSK